MRQVSGIALRLFCKHTVSGTISLALQAFFSPFPHGTCSLSVTWWYLALRDGPRRFRPNFTCPAVLGNIPGDYTDFAYETITRCGAPFQASSAIWQFGNSSGLSHSPVERPATPDRQRLRPYTSTRFRLFPVRSPLLGESLFYFLFLGLLRWFSSPGSLCQTYRIAPFQFGIVMNYHHEVAPFGYRRIKAR